MGYICNLGKTCHQFLDPEVMNSNIHSIWWGRSLKA
jgi:hypothetical protein